MEENKDTSRRKFLDKGLKIGVATALGGIGLSKLASKLYANSISDSGEKMELMTTDGTIVQVDSSDVVEAIKSQIGHMAHMNHSDIREGSLWLSIWQNVKTP